MIYTQGDLIAAANQGAFDVVVHGCNCFNSMKSGIAPQLAEAYGCDKFRLEDKSMKGDINKLGQIDFKKVCVLAKPNSFFYSPDPGPREITFIMVNAYTQYYNSTLNPGKVNLDYDALRLCMRKINTLFSGKRVGMPMIGSGLAGGDWNIIEKILNEELYNVELYIMHL